ncbi:MAG: ATP-binding protein [Clostridia bacterium]|nr:ATP-binding protein [Clostridia bacterium]
MEIVKAGASVILDWGFWSEEDRKEITSFFRSNGVPFVWHYLDTDDALWQENIRQRNARVQQGEGGSDFYVDDGLLRKMRALFEEPTRDAMDVWVEVTGQHEQRITRKGERMDFPQEQDCEGKTI